MRNWLLVVLLISLASCDPNRVYDTNEDIVDQKWAKGQVLTFEFDIDDLNSNYNVLANITNAQHYPFHNLYYQYQLIGPDNQELSKELVNINLFDPKTGEPFGEGLGDIFDHRQLILKNFKFPQTGKYSMNLEHYMRVDTLPLIMAVGVRVEKVETE